MTAELGFAISGASGRCAVTSVAGAKRLKLYLQKVTQKMKVWRESMIKTCGTCQWWDDNGVCNNDAAVVFQTGEHNNCPFWENYDEEMWGEGAE